MIHNIDFDCICIWNYLELWNSFTNTGKINHASLSKLGLVLPRYMYVIWSIDINFLQHLNIWLRNNSISDNASSNPMASWKNVWAVIIYAFFCLFLDRWTQPLEKSCNIEHIIHQIHQKISRTHKHMYRYIAKLNLWVFSRTLRKAESWL